MARFVFHAGQSGEIGWLQVADAARKGIGDWVRGVPEFIRQVQAETRKVVWPTRKETVMTAVMVLIMTSVLAIFFFAVDSVFSRIVRALLGLLG